MNKKAVSNELIKIARIINADAGDVPVFFNVSDFMQRKDGGMMDSDTAFKASHILQKASMEA